MIIEKVFAKLYKTYEYPFESSDQKIAKMKDAERTEYYRQCKDLIENKAFVQEMQEAVRTMYGELACRTVNKNEQAGYRLTLKFIQDLEKRIRIFSNMYKAPSINEAFKTKL